MEPKLPEQNGLGFSARWVRARWAHPQNVSQTTAKPHYIEPQGTGVNGSIYPRCEINHIHLSALIVVWPFTIVR